MHLVRASLNYVSWRDRKPVAYDLRNIYRATTAEQAEKELELFAQAWNQKYPTIALLWKRNWDQITPFFALPAEIRRVIYTTNAVESLHMSLRKIIKMRSSFPSEEAALKLLYMARRNVTKKWGVPPNWKAALNHFALLWDNRLPERFR